MLSIETHKKLADLFLQISQLERSVEENRILLSSHKDFDPYSTFLSIDRLNIGYLSSTEIILFLDKHSIFISQDEAHQLINQYDSNQDNLLSLTEYFSLVLPSTNPFLKSSALSHHGYFSTEIESLLIQLLQSEAQYHRYINNTIKALILQNDFTLSKCFKAIDQNNINYIKKSDLKSYLHKQNHTIIDDDINAIFRRLDNDSDGVINYQEFIEFISPNKRSLEYYKKSLNDIQANCNEKLNREDRFLDKGKNSSPLRKSIGKNSEDGISLLGKSLTCGSYLKGQDESCESLDCSGGLKNLEGLLRRSSPLRGSPLRFSKGFEFSPRSDFTGPLKSVRSFESGWKSGRNGNRSLKSYGNRENSLRKSSPLKKPMTEFKSFSSYNSLESSSYSRFSMSSSSFEEKELVNCFKEEIKIAREVEKKKNELALKPDFNLFDAYKMFDFRDLGTVKLEDFENAFQYLAFTTQKDAVFLLIKRYCTIKSNNGLTYEDFSHIFSPKQEEFIRILKNRISAGLGGFERLRVFTKDTLDMFLNTLKLILEAEILAEKVRQRLSNMQGFSMHQAFITVDKDRDGFITIDEFQTMLHSHGVFATSKDLQGLLDKYDKNRDGKVSYSEFVEEVTPKSTKKI